MADAGEAIALAAVVDLITSVHFELQDGFLSSDGVETRLDVVRGCSHHCDCSMASILAVASENNLLM
jgi:hypothetical protein